MSVITIGWHVRVWHDARWHNKIIFMYTKLLGDTIVIDGEDYCRENDD